MERMTFVPAWWFYPTPLFSPPRNILIVVSGTDPFFKKKWKFDMVINIQNVLKVKSFYKYKL